MTEPTQTCTTCGDVEIVRQDGRGFPPDIARRRLERRCNAKGHRCTPQYRAGVSRVRGVRARTEGTASRSAYRGAGGRIRLCGRHRDVACGTRGPLWRSPTRCATRSGRPYTRIDPVTELAMMCPDMPVIVVAPKGATQ